MTLRRFLSKSNYLDVKKKEDKFQIQSCFFDSTWCLLNFLLLLFSTFMCDSLALSVTVDLPGCELSTYTKGPRIRATPWALAPRGAHTALFTVGPYDCSQVGPHALFRTVHKWAPHALFTSGPTRHCSVLFVRFFFTLSSISLSSVFLKKIPNICFLIFKTPVI